MNKTARRIAVYSLTGGACTYLGLLSLGGMYALYPLISLALLSFTLSVAYEGEIYKQNLTHALKKLIQPKNLQKNTANLYLKSLFDAHPEIVKTKSGLKSCPEFFRNYLFLLLKAHHDATAGKQLKDLENWFCEVVFEAPKKTTANSAYEKELFDWLAQQKDDLKPEQWRTNYQKQQKLRRFVAIPLSILASIFTTLGTTYLLFETITIVPALLVIPLSVWSALVIPLALSAGLAYGLLTYNCSSDFLRNNPFSKWFHKINALRLEGQSVKAVMLGISFSFLCLLAIGLTVCTAGTWCTIVTQGQSFYSRINNLPKWLMGIVNPFVITLSSTAFNLQNTSDTFGMLSKTKTTPIDWLRNKFTEMKTVIKDTKKNESWLQFINPFRALHTLLFSPSRVILFAGHLISIGVTSDRVPKISKELSALLGTLCEFGEDWHYFFGDHCHGDHKNLDLKELIKELLEERLEGEGHNHALDLPTQALKLVLSPIKLLSYGWEKAAVKIVASPATTQPHAPQKDEHHDCHHHHHHHAKKSTQKTTTWAMKNPAWFIENYQKKHALQLSSSATQALQQFTKDVTKPMAKQPKIDTWTSFLKTRLEKNKAELPEHFVEKFNARFGAAL